MKTARITDAARRALPCALLSAVACAAVPAVAGAATSDATVRLRLDARKGMQPVKTPKPLKRGVQYIATVEGTFAYYAAPEWLGRTPCGPAVRPRFASPGVRNTFTGTDTEFTFAVPRKGTTTCGVLPYRFGNFEISTGLSFSHRPAIGTPAKPNALHRYRYLLKGQGARVRFRLRDVYTGDNYGVVHIAIRRAPKGYKLPVPKPVVPAPAPVPVPPAPPVAPAA